MDLTCSQCGRENWKIVDFYEKKMQSYADLFLTQVSERVLTHVTMHEKWPDMQVSEVDGKIQVDFL